MPDAVVRVEYASQRKLRDRNKLGYRVAHWPIWITVFYLLPGPATFRLFAHGVDLWMGAWLGIVLVGTGVAGIFGQLPGVEPRPYIIRFTEDKPNPLYRRICYTAAWSELICYAVLNLAGIAFACFTGKWRMAQIYDGAYLPMAAAIWILGILGLLPRVKRSTKGEGDERRYFYALVWAAPLAQAVVWLLWQSLPVNSATNWIKLAAFAAILASMGRLAARGLLPRTRKIVPGELAISD
jgi:ABC-type multidrug transport system fused ATPase/permease subunit